MVYYLSEEKILKMLEKTDRVSVFSLEKGAKYKTISDELDMPIPAIDDMFPDTAVRQKIANGEISGKKVIKAVEKILKDPAKAKDTDLPVNVYMLISILIRNAKEGVLTAIIEPDFGDNSKLEKFANAYIKMLFGTFNYKVADGSKKNRKEMKKLLKGKKKDVKAKIKKAAHGTTMDSSGVKRYNAIKKAFDLEILSNSLNSRIREDGIKLNKKQQNNLKESLVKAFKKGGKLSKKMKKYYDEIQDLNALDLPKSKKLNKIKKSMVPIVIRHLATRRLGLDLCSKEYFREMAPVIKALGADEKAFREELIASTK